MSGDTTMIGESKVTLKSCDNQIFEVEELVAFESQMLKDMIEDIGSESVIFLPKVTSKTLSMIVEYCKYHVGVRKSSRTDEKPTVPKEEIEIWDAEFIKAHELTRYSNVCEVILATSYLNIQTMLDFGGQIVADEIKGKSVEEIRAYCAIENDFGPGEEELIKKENEWAFV